MRSIKAYVAGMAVSLVLALPAAAPRPGGGGYYQGMNDRVRRGDYDRYSRDDERRHHHDNGGIGPGKGTLIGGAGGAALGAIFGGGLKGSLIGGAAGAGIGALGAQLAEGNDNRRGRDRRR